MCRLATFLHFLTALTAGLGLWGVGRMYQPEGWTEWWQVAALAGPAALDHPAVWIAAVVAFTATAGAWWTERVERAPSSPRKRRRLRHSTSAARPAAARPAASRLGGGSLDRDRRRLEALLRGRGDMVEFVDQLLALAVERRASDVHIQPRDGTSLVTLRIEGELFETATIAEAHHAPLVRRLKILAELIPYKTDIPQDGRFAVAGGAASEAADAAGDVDIRISIVPTRHGEKVVLRLVRPAAGLIPLAELGFDEDQRPAFEALLDEPQGLVVLTGPTGSGKTTTIYSALDHLHAKRGQRVQIATIEDPVEIEQSHLSQTQVDRARGLDFATALRAVLRQDPNVLMVGEIRDAETAEIAVQAGLSGHLVLTTLHAESAAGVFVRLVDLGVEPFLCASATLACLSQRLVRTLCPACRQPAPLRRSEIARLVRHGVAVDGLTFFRAPGCRSCERSGVVGRQAVFELLRLTPDLRRRIAAGVATPEIERLAREAGLRPLAQTLARRAAAGEIAVDEVLRTVG